MGGRYDFVDEIGPIMRPFLLQDGNQNKIELIQEGALRAKALIRVGDLDNDVNDEIPDA
jgi:hypothetical protein